MKLIPKRPSLVSEVADVLRDGIIHQRWIGHLPGERLLCEQLQVSRPTLRAALSQLERDGLISVSHGKHRAILNNFSAKQSKSRLRRIGFLNPVDLVEMEGYVGLKVAGLEHHLHSAGFSLELHIRPGCFTARPERALSELVSDVPATVWILQRSTEQMQRWFHAQRIPAAVHGSTFPGIELPSIDLDQRALGRHAASQLLARGHRQICFLRRSEHIAGVDVCEAGFLEAFSGNRYQDAQPIVVKTGSTREDIRRKLDSLFKRNNRPTAIVSKHARVTLTLITYAATLGLRIPDDLSIISSEDSLFFKDVHPVINRYTREYEKNIRRLVQIVVKLANKQPLHALHSLIMPEYLPGDSVK